MKQAAVTRSADGSLWPCRNCLNFSPREYCVNVEASLMMLDPR
jgi:hypothetical protein